jgi:hypothetical protein
MPIVKIVPMPGPQGPGGSGEGGDIADFVFDTVSEDNTESRMTVANHDMLIRTTRDDGQDADIELNSADDIWINAYDQIELTAENDNIDITALNDSVYITAGGYRGEDGEVWQFQSDGGLVFPDGTTQTTAYVAPETEIIPLPDFLTYATGRDHLPALNTNFGWNSNGVYFGPTPDGGIEGHSYPVFTDFTINETTPVRIELEVVVAEDCADAGIALYVDGTTPEWQWGGTNSTRIAAQFNCLNAELSGINLFTGLGENSPLIGPETYLVIINYTPGEGVVFDYGTQMNQLGSLSLAESLPTGNYRIGFAADNDSNDDEGDAANNRTYIKNLTITLAPGTIDEVIYTDTLLNGNSGAPIFGTGDITFDGVKIIGAGEASGDGYGNGTIELVPDANLYQNDQYLIIDPTGPNHIHIRAGGTQDESQAYLIIGAEKTNVLLNDGAGSVEIHSKPSPDADVYQNINSEPGNTLSVNADLTFLLDSPRPGINYVSTGSALYEITSWSVTEGITNIVAGDFTFDANGFYSVLRDYPSHEWDFDSDGYLYGPAEGALPVKGLVGPLGDADLEILAPTAIVLNGQFGEFLDSSADSNNQIATIGDVGVETSYTVNGGAIIDAPTFDGDPLFTGSYVKTGPMVHFQIQVDMDNILTFGAGQYFVELPFAAKYAYQFRAGCLHDISGEDQFAISGHVAAGQTMLMLQWTNSNGQDEAFTPSAPVALSTADNFHISGDYIADTEE